MKKPELISIKLLLRQYQPLFLPGCLFCLIVMGTACSGIAEPVQKQNSIPVIGQVVYSKYSLESADNTIICQASDADGDELQYKWSADSGRIDGGGASITWISPEVMGNYIVTVSVTDGKGGEAAQDANIRVLNNADGTTMLPITLKMTLPSEDVVSEKVTVKVGTATRIICATEKPSDGKLTYEWSADGGKLQIKGQDEKSSAAACWTAPANTKEYLVTVIVNDEKGNHAQGQVIFDVFCCPRN
jgi:hypothetical protein